MYVHGWKKRERERVCEKLSSITRVENVIYQKSIVTNEHQTSTKTGEANGCVTFVCNLKVPPVVVRVHKIKSLIIAIGVCHDSWKDR